MSLTGEQKTVYVVLGGLLLFTAVFAWQVSEVLKLQQEIEVVDPTAIALQTLAEKKPLSKMSNFELGQYYFNHDEDPAGPYDLKKARHNYTEALREDPKGNNLTWYQLGRIDFIEGKFDTALYKFNKQIEYFNDRVPNVYYMIGLTHGYKARRQRTEGSWGKAEEAFLKFIELNGMSWASRVDLSWIYFAQGKYEEMMPLLEEALPHYPDNAWLHNMYGLALLNTGERERARGQFMLAQAAAEKLTTEDWGESYPGNDPADWDQGLTEFRAAIKKNLTIIRSAE